MTLSLRRFDQAVRDYRPLPFETFATDDPRFRKPLHHVLRNRDRLCEAVVGADRYLPPGPLTVADLGTYPGSLLRLLRRLLAGRPSRLIGVGLMSSDDFRRAMGEDCDAEILTGNLDPANHHLRDKGHPTRIPLGDGSVDLVFALEVIEHLVSPSHLLAEAVRILRPGGHILVTTPNVARIGNVFKLVIGRSNFDRLVPLDYDNPDDEWRPHFREYTLVELCGQFRQAGFSVAEARHFMGEDTRYLVRTPRRRPVELAKLPFSLVPHFRASLFAVGRKPAGGTG
jgi:SAM-dependent methyltransferase